MTQIELLTILGAIFIAPHINRAFSLIIGGLYVIGSFLLRFL
jgi:hypothetical protein